MASVFQDSVAQAIAEQPSWVRRKDSLTAVAGTVLQLGNLALLMTADGPAWVNIIIGALIGVAQIIIHAGTKGAITPSMAVRLEQAGANANLDRLSVSAPTWTAVNVSDSYSGRHRVENGLPVYNQPSTGE